MDKKKSSLGKKLLIVFGSLLALLVVAAIVVPLVVDVDKYRPMIVAKTNEKLNGKLELGHLDLSLWGQVKVDVDGLKLSDAEGNRVVEVRDASFRLPLLSLLTGRPELRLVLDSPIINVVKFKSGKLNVMTLMKETAPEAQPQAKPGDAPAEAGKTEIPAIAMNSRITFLIRDARVTYADKATGDTYKVDDLDVRLEDVSPASTMPFEVVAKLDVAMKQGLKLSGPAVLKGSVKASTSQGELDRLEAKADVDLDDLTIVYPGMFNKSKGVPLGAELTAISGKTDFSVPTMKLRLDEVTIDGQASGKITDQATTVEFKMQSSRIDIAKLSNLSPLIKEYDLNGIVELTASAQGPVDKLGYGANLKFNNINLKHATLKQPIALNGAVVVVTNAVKSMTAKLAAKDFDLSMAGSMEDFVKPRFKFNVTSANMDLDQLLVASAEAAEQRKQEAQKVAQGKAPKQEPVVDYNAMFKPLRENAIAAAAAGTVDFRLNRIKSTGVVLKDVKGQLTLNNLVAALKDFSLGVFDGSVKGAATFNMKTAKPEVAANLLVTGLDTSRMVESQVPFARNTVKGVVGAALNIGGPGINPGDVTSKWNGTGSFDFKNAVFSTFDVAREIKTGVIDKLPGAAKAAVESRIPERLMSGRSEYELVMGKFGLRDGVMSIPEVIGKARPNLGFDFKGSGNAGLQDYRLDMSMSFIDTYNILNAEKKLGSSKYGGHTGFTAHVGGNLFQPKFDWKDTVMELAQTAAKNEAQSRGMELLKKKFPGMGNGSKDGGNKKPEDAVKDAFKGLFKRK